MFARRAANRGNKRRKEASDSEKSEKIGLEEKAALADGKRRKRGGFSSKEGGEEGARGLAPSAVFLSSGAQMEGVDQGATRLLESEVSRDQDARAIFERNLELQKQMEGGELEEGLYRGQKAYKQYVQVDIERKKASSKFTGALGPNRASQHARIQCRFDYQPDICKDYKETGYCTFGDSCKFLHDRSDYKTGWALEKEFEEEQAKLNKKKETKAQRRMEKMQAKLEGGSEIEDSSSSSSSSSSSDEDEGSLPFACMSCKKPWKMCCDDEQTPVKTVCEHYFCEPCFFEKCVKLCPVCQKSTSGIFNAAEDINEKLEKQRALKEERREASKRRARDLASGVGRAVYGNNLE